MQRGGLIPTFTLAARFFKLIAASVFCSLTLSAQAMTVCADPDNLPFSKAEGPERGLYVEVAELVAKHLKQPITFDWYYSNNQRRALRNSILAKTCDAYYALPADADYKTRGLQRTRGFLQVSHVLVAAPGFKFKALDDLKGKRVAVEFGGTPQVMLSTLDDVDLVTVHNATEAFEALAKGEVDVALLWGPTAGYVNRNQVNKNQTNSNQASKPNWQFTPVTGKGLGGLVAVAVRRDNDQLTQDIDRALAELTVEIGALADRYGFPRGKAVELEKIARVMPNPVTSMVKLVASHAAAASRPAAKTAPKAKAAASAAAVKVTASPFDALDAAGHGGRERFNSACSHCHSVDGASPMRERDLRRLNMRYGDKWPELAVTTINEGRSSAGMPSWKDAIKPDEVQGILAFLKVIQK